jgi:spore coat polysaccharide biosynthesis predicted glycosyltransferase SpsG
MNDKILFLTDANKKIGIGHLMRSIRTGKELLKFTKNIFIIFKTKKKIDKKKIFKKIYYATNYNEIYNLIIKIKPNLLILDLPKHNLQFEKKLFLNNIKFLIYDRFNRKKIYSNFLINLNPIIKKKDYKKKLTTKTQLFLGPKYFPINSKTYKKKNLSKIKNILIFLGGGRNDYNLIGKIFNVLDKSSLKDCKIFFITMNKVDGIKKKKYKNQYNLRLNFVNNTDDIYNYIRKSDLSIITSGSISFESCFFKVPMILLSIAENQVGLAKSWNKLEAGYYVGKSENKNFEIKLNNSINDLSSLSKRNIMIDKQKKFFDNKFNFTSDFIKILKK